MTDDVAAVLQGWRNSELRVQHCASCGHSQFPPRAICLACRSERLSWALGKPMGTIVSFTVVHRAPTHAFKARVPYAIALVDLAPGIRMMMNVDAAGFDRLEIGALVTIAFATAAGDAVPRPVARLA